MKRQLFLSALALILGAVLIPAAAAQNGQVKGKITDQTGKPVVNGTVELNGKNSGGHYKLKTDKHGEYYSLGIRLDTYDFVIYSPEGQKLWQLSGIPVKLGDDTVVNIDLQKEMAKAQTQQEQQMTPEQKKALEEQQKESSKIKGLNAMLAQAAQQQEAGQFDAAVETLTQATAADPTRDLLWFKLADAERLAASKTTGDIAGQKEKYLKAVEDYKKAIAIKPNGAYYNNMGEAYVKAGDIPNAIAAYNQAAQIDPPGAGKYFFNEGAVLTNTGKVDDAIAAFDKSIQADPTKADSYYWKGVNMIGKATMKGDKMVAPEGTAEAFNKYLELDPTGQFADPAKQMLASIGAKVETTFGKPRPAKKK